MANKQLLDNVEKLGVSLLRPEERVDVPKTLADVVKSHDGRLWEHYPVLFSAALEKYAVAVSQVQKQLDQSLDKKALRDLTALMGALRKEYHLPLKDYQKSLQKTKEDFSVWEKQAKRMAHALAHQPYVTVANVELSTQRVRRAFEEYLNRQRLQEQKQTAQYDEYALEYALSQLFSPKQKELFRKKLKGEKLTKTEREYYSRTVRKKLAALANPELHRLAQKLIVV